MRTRSDLAVARVELMNGLPSPEDALPLPRPLSTADSLLAKEILGMEEYTSLGKERLRCSRLWGFFLVAETVWK
jgi:hypothetical protein